MAKLVLSRCRVASSSVLSWSRPLHTSSSWSSRSSSWHRGNLGTDETETERFWGSAEMKAKQAANDNPFETYVVRPEVSQGLTAGTAIPIPSMNPSRLIGCCCESDYNQVVWFHLNSGEAQQCDCGVYFKLVSHDPLDPNVKPRFGRGFGSGFSTRYF